MHEASIHAIPCVCTITEDVNLIKGQRLQRDSWSVMKEERAKKVVSEFHSFVREPDNVPATLAPNLILSKMIKNLLVSASLMSGFATLFCQFWP